MLGNSQYYSTHVAKREQWKEKVKKEATFDRLMKAYKTLIRSEKIHTRTEN
jgi:hypothetical protein